jgi:50S ribosomal protein L16 3-hydroxylase
MTRHFLGGMDASRFLRRHWQKEPLVARGALREYSAIVNRDRLVQLARREDIESQIVIRTRGRWRVLRGPFAPRDFAKLPARGWTLLVHGVDLAMPEMSALVREFSFLPYARFDDVMVSYAAPGGGVGPHFDSYDVFLLHAQGTRRWRLGSQSDLELDPRAPLKILRCFKPEQQWDLEAGDVLYLPPRWAHDGVAIDECVTCSIGFRAPHAQELAERFLDFHRDRIALDGLYEDAGIAPTREPARVPTHLVTAAERWIAQAQWSAQEVGEFLGSYLSEPKPHVVFERPRAPLTKRQFEQRVHGAGVELAPGTRMLYRGAHVFINGEAIRAARPALPILEKLANDRVLAAGAIAPAALDLLHDWYTAGYIRLTPR